MVTNVFIYKKDRCIKNIDFDKLMDGRQYCNRLIRQLDNGDKIELCWVDSKTKTLYTETYEKEHFDPSEYE